MVVNAKNVTIALLTNIVTQQEGVYGTQQVSTVLNQEGLGEQKMTETTTKNYTVTESLNSGTITEYLQDIIVPVSILVLAVLIFGTVFIRKWYTKTRMKRQDSRTQGSTTEERYDHATESSDIYNRLTLRVKYQNPYVDHAESLIYGGGPSYCSGPTMDKSSHQRKKHSHINRFKPGTVCKENNEELQTHIVDIGKTHDRNPDHKPYIYSTSSKHARKQLRSNNSEQKQQRAGRKTLKPKLQEPILDTILHEQNSRTKHPACTNGTNDEELYANYCDMENSNHCLRRDHSLDEDSNEYFNVRYEGKMTRSLDQINTYDRSEPSSLETCPESSDYVNCGLAKGFYIQ